MSTLKNELRSQAKGLGFHDVRCTRITPDTRTAEHLDAFLAHDRHGDMDWLAAHAARRRDVTNLWPDAKTALVLSFVYTPERDPLDALKRRDHAAISVYAQGKDYHDIIKPKLKQLARALQSATGEEVKVFVDTAPLMEKPLGQRAGLGWQGKHTNLVSRAGGSWFFIGVILTTATLEPDEPETDHCGACRKCLDICPTQAFPNPYQLDARRCISYLTIEHKGHIDQEFRAAIGNRVYGCDDCLAVCPWNKFAADVQDMRLRARAETDNPPLSALLELDDAAFRERFRGTPVKRTGRDRFVRNVLIAAGNAQDTSLVPKVEALLRDSAALVRAMAVWALAQLCDRAHFQRQSQVHLPNEPDSAVKAEWHAALKLADAHPAPSSPEIATVRS